MKPTIAVTPYEIAMLAATLHKEVARVSPEEAVNKAILLLEAAERAWTAL